MWGGKEEVLFKPRAVNEVEAERDRATPTGGGGMEHVHARKGRTRARMHTRGNARAIVQ